jgi:hypothetical protein
MCFTLKVPTIQRYVLRYKVPSPA